MSSIFSKIISGEVPCYKIAEDENYFSFLDINPLVPGHTLVIPKKEIDYIFDLEDDHLAGLHVFAKKIAKAVGKAIPCQRVGVTVIGLEVPHAHVHLVPLQSMSDMNFANAKLTLPPEQMSEIADRIKKEL